MKLFVYGTLKRGFSNHQLLKDSQFLGFAQTKDRYPLIKTYFGLPILLPFKDTGHNVRGEVYEVSSSLMKAIDKLEGHPNINKRELISVISDVAQKELKFVSIYFFQKTELEELKDEELFREYNEINIKDIFDTAH